VGGQKIFFARFARKIVPPTFKTVAPPLIHRGSKGKMQKVVKKDEKGVIHQLHAGVIGDCHFGINATQKKVIQIFIVFAVIAISRRSHRVRHPVWQRVRQRGS